MTDRAFETPDNDPFSQINPDRGGAILATPKPTAQPISKPVNPFDDINPDRGGKIIGQQPETSATGALVRHAAEAVVPALGGLPAAGAGAEAGALLGGALGPVGALAGGFAGGVAGFMGAGYALQKAQDYALSKLPDAWQDALGISEAQRGKEEAAHPVASFIGGLIPYALTLRPGMATKIPLPENATSFQRLWANPVTQRLFPATIMGGMELGQEKVEGQPADWQKVGIATGFGLIFNKPTKFGERLTEVGAHPARRALGIPEPTLAPPQEKPAPTVAGAADAKVMGPGINEQVFQGEQEMNPTAAMVAQYGRRMEMALSGEAPPLPDVGAAARASAPEAFALWDDLHIRESMLRAWIPEMEERGQEPVSARYHLADTQRQINELTPEIQAAYRRAAELAGTPSIVPEAGAGQFPTLAAMVAGQAHEGAPAAPPVAAEGAPVLSRSIPEQQAAIYTDVRGQLIRAGYDPAWSEDTARLEAARYVARAQAIGEQPEALYRAKGPQFVGRPGAPPPAGGAPPIVPGPAAPTRLGPVTAEEAAAAEGRAPGAAAPVAPRPRETVRAEGFAPIIGEAEKSGMIDNAEAYKAAAMKRRERTGGGGKVYISAAAEAQAHGVSVQAVNRARAEAETAKGGEFDKGIAEAQITPEEVSPEVRTTAIEAMVNLGMEPVEALDYAMMKIEREAGVHESEDSLLAAEGIIATEEGYADVGKIPFETGEGAAVARAAGRPATTAEEALAAREPAREAGGVRPEEAEREYFQRRRDLITPTTVTDQGNGNFFVRSSEHPNDDLLSLKVKPTFVHAGLSMVDEDRRGQGIAVALYERALEFAAQRGLPLRSDMSVSADAMRVYDALKRRGYEVTEAPDSHTSAKGITNALAGYVYEVKPKPIAETGAEGKPQLVLPGAERITQAELAKRKAAEPLKPTVEQKPMDEGLFGEPGKQKELFQAARRSNNPELRAAIDAGDWRKIVEIQREIEGLRAAMRDPITGNIYTGGTHQAAIETVPKGEGEIWTRLHNEWDRGTENTGFVDRAGNFISRDEADRRWKILTMEDVKDQRELFQAAKGKVTFREAQRPVITLFRTADASTAIHELGHTYLEELMEDAQHPNSSSVLKGDADTVLDWLKVEKADDIKGKHHEKFARGFEQYMREGITPSPELAGVFSRFKQWLLDIYQSVRALIKRPQDEIAPEIRSVFDRLLAAEPQRTTIAAGLERRPTLADIHESDAALTEPHEAEPVRDRIAAERDRYAAETPPEIINEISQAEAKRAEATEPTGEAGPGPGGGAALEPGGERPGVEPPGGAVRPEHGAVEPGHGGAEPEGAELPSGKPSEGGPITATEPRAGVAGESALASGPSPLLGGESPFLDRAGNIRRDHVNVPNDVWAAIKARAKANQDFIGARRGIVSPGQILDLAHRIGMDGAEDIVQKWTVGSALNAEEITALGELVEKQAIDTAALARSAKDEPSPENTLRFVTEQARLDMFLRTFMGGTAEAGRTLYAVRMMNAKMQGLNEAFQAATGKTLFQIRREIKATASMDDPAKVNKMMQDRMKPTWGRMILEYLVNDWLSGIPSHLTYLVGNKVLMAERLLLITPTAAMVGKLLGHEGQVVQLGEVRAGLQAIRGALPAATKGIGQSFRSGLNVLLPGEEVQTQLPFQMGTEMAVRPTAEMTATWQSVASDFYGTVSGMRDGMKSWASMLAAGGVEGAPTIGARRSDLGYIPDIEIKGVAALPVGTMVRAPSRMVAAIHTSTRILNYAMDIQQQAFRMAIAEGLEGGARDARIGELIQNPTLPMMEHAHQLASAGALMEQAGTFMRKITQLTNWETELPGLGLTQPLKFIDPFVTVAGNIFKQSLGTQTPLGLLSTEVRADIMGRNGNVAQEIAIAKMVIGSAVGLTFGFLAGEGLMNGSGPTDRNKFMQWRYQMGNLPHSVRIGEMWFDLHRLGSLGMLASAAADMYEVAHSMSQADGQTAAAMFMHAITQNFLDEGFMRGPADLIKAIEDSGRYGDAYVRNFLSGFVPYSVGMAQFARDVDPYSRQTRTFMDAVKAKIPYLSETLLPRRDIWGEPLVNLDALGYGATVIHESRVTHDPVNIAMFQLGISPGLPDRKIRNVKLTDDQYDDFQRIAGRMAKMRLDRIVNSPQWQTFPNHIKLDVLKHEIESDRNVAREMMLMKYPQIAKDAYELRLKKLKD